MAGPNRNFFTLFTSRLSESKQWYTALFGYRVEFDSDWFVHLQSPSGASIELGLLARDHELVPAAFRTAPAGGMLTIVVADVDAVCALARARGDRIVEEPTNQFYGQRRMLLLDSEGLLVDVSSECSPDARWLESLKS